MEDDGISEMILNHDAIDFIVMERRDANNLLRQMPENLWWYVKEDRWSWSSSEDLAELAMDYTRSMVPAMRLSIYRELCLRSEEIEKSEKVWKNFTFFLRSEIDRFKARELRDRDIGIEIGLNGRVGRSNFPEESKRFTKEQKLMFTDIRYPTFQVFAEFPDWNYIESLIWSTYDDYNWYDNESGQNRHVHDLIIFLSKVSDECKDRITKNLTLICEENEESWRNSTFFELHSGSFEALRLIETEITDKVEVGIQDSLWKIAHWEEIQRSIAFALGNKDNL